METWKGGDVCWSVDVRQGFYRRPNVKEGDVDLVDASCRKSNASSRLSIESVRTVLSWIPLQL